MATEYTIGPLAAAAGVPTSTVRYYERVGLVEADGRSESNYRLYGPDALERVRFIRAAQATGFSLDDIKALLALRDGVAAPCGTVRQLIEERISHVGERMKDLRHVQKVLKASLELCLESEESETCKVIEQLREKSRT